MLSKIKKYLLIFFVILLEMNSYKILKFGGSSLKSSKDIKNVGNIIKDIKSKEKDLIVVCSACGDSTNKLLNLKRKIDFEIFKKYHSDIINELEIKENIKEEYKNLMKSLYKKKFLNYETRDNKYNDNIVSYGERLSVLIVSNYLKKIGIKSKNYNSYDLGFITNNNYGNAKLLESSEEKIKINILNIERGTIPVITGFIGKSNTNNTTTLGRGGSDLTATIIGKCINAKEVQVWKDVNGIYTCDPKIIKESKLIPVLNFNDALKLANTGAKVLHPLALEPCKERNIPVIIKNSYNIKANGTVINNNNKESKCWIGITYKTDISIIKIYLKDKNKSKIFNYLEKRDIDIDIINMSDKELYISINEKDLFKVNDLKEKMNIKTNMISLSIISNKDNKILEILNKIYKKLEKEEIKIYLMNKVSLKKHITLILDSKYLFTALSSIHKLLIK